MRKREKSREQTQKDGGHIRKFSGVLGKRYIKNILFLICMETGIIINNKEIDILNILMWILFFLGLIWLAMRVI